MKKFYLLFFIFVFFIFFSSKSVFADIIQDCGDPNAADSAKKCCNVDPGNMTSNPELNKTLKNTACVGVWFIQWCPPDMEDVLNSTKGILNTDALKELQKIGVCRNGSVPTKLNPADPDCQCVFLVPTGALSNKYCDQYIAGNGPKKSLADLLKNKEYTGCVDCFRASGFWTGLGCFYMSDAQTFIRKNVFGIGLGFAGMIALLCIIYSAFVFQISQGNPEKIKTAQERLTSCILGLLLIIFSVFILRLIGVSILRIPGFQ